MNKPHRKLKALVPWVFAALVLVGFTPPEAGAQDDAGLLNLTISAGTLTPAFDPDTLRYDTSVANDVGELEITLEPRSGTNSITVQVGTRGSNNVETFSPGLNADSSGSYSPSLVLGESIISILVENTTNGTQSQYRIYVTRRDPIPTPPDVATLPPSSFLIPHVPNVGPAFGVGDVFRVMFADGDIRATSSDISTYNTHVQNEAASYMGNNGPSANYASQFRALISTPQVDARDNTATNRVTANHQDAPIYWIGGDKIADNYADLYDGDWDSPNWTNRNGGTQRPNVGVWTGSRSNGTGYVTREAGRSEVRLGARGFTSEIDFLSRVPTASGGDLFLYGLSPLILVSNPTTLGSLSVTRANGSEVALSPAFHGGITTYHAAVASTESSITVNANPVHSTATVSEGSTQTFQLPNVGIHTFNITVIAPSASSTTYTINVTRQELLPGAPATQILPQNSPLVSSALNVGDQFRLLFVNPSSVAANRSDIGHYNNAVKRTAAAATSQADIRAFSDQFRALLSTTTLDARDNTATTGTGVPIYWVGGARVANNYADFYDGSWDSRAPHNAAGAGLTPTGLNIMTGSNADGSGDFTLQAGSSNIRLGRLDQGAGAEIHSDETSPRRDFRQMYALSPLITLAGPDTTLSNLTVRDTTAGAGIVVLGPSFNPVKTDYAASVSNDITSITLTPTLGYFNATATIGATHAGAPTLATVAIASGATSEAIPLNEGVTLIRIVVTSTRGPAQTTIYELEVSRLGAPPPPPVPRNLLAGSPVVPPGLPIGAQFRLLFVGSGSTPTNPDISHYNGIVIGDANGVADLRPVADQFRALLSTATLDARDNTGTRSDAGSDDVPIYWVGGDKVADNYADFYNNSWDSRTARDPSGNAFTTTELTGLTIMTGSLANGIGQSTTRIGDRINGIRVGRLDQGAGDEIDSGPVPGNGAHRLYGLSPVFTLLAVAASQPPVVQYPIPGQSATALEPFSYTFPANTFHDINMDELTYSVAAPAWLTIDPASARTVRGTPLSAMVAQSPISVTVAASDGDPATVDVSDTFLLTVNVGNPAPPANVRAVGGDRSITVSWDPVVEDGGATVFDFTAQVSPIGNVLVQNCVIKDDPGATSCTITGLLNGRSYSTITVHVTTSVYSDSDPRFRQEDVRTSTTVRDDIIIIPSDPATLPLPPPPADAFVTTWQPTTSFLSEEVPRPITIPTHGGSTYAYTVDWGDGSNDAATYTGDATHVYAPSNTLSTESNLSGYVVTIRGLFPRIYFNDNSEKDKIYTIKQWGTTAWSSMENSFRGCTNLNIESGAGQPDLSAVTSMRGMFRDAHSFGQSIDGWDVSGVTDMSRMFDNAHSFNQPIDSWDVSSVTDMDFMFFNANTFNQDLSAWTVSGVSNMTDMFRGAAVFNQPIGSWDVSSVTDMEGMFNDAIAFNQDLSAWDVDGVSNMTNMFYGATAFNQPIGGWDVSSVTPTNMQGMFNGATAFNQDLSAWDVDRVSNMTDMFNGALAFNQNLGAWDVSAVTTADNMLVGTALSTANYDALLRGWSEVTGDETGLQQDVPFHAGNSQYCDFVARDQLAGAPRSWAITDGGRATNCPSVPGAFVTTWEVTAGQTLTIPTNSAAGSYDYAVDWGDGTAASTAQSGDATHTYTNAGNYTVTITGDFPQLYINGGAASSVIRSVQQWGDQVWGSMQNSFASATNFVIAPNAGQPILSLGTSMQSMFLGATSTNSQIGHWDVSNVTNMASMFQNARAFNQDLSAWDVSGVTNFSRMFNQATSFNQNLGDWDVSSATTLVDMFHNVTLSRENYDSLLAGWSAIDTAAGEKPLQTSDVNNMISFSAGNSIYCNQEAKNILLNAPSNGGYGWNIQDGGGDTGGNCSLRFIVGTSIDDQTYTIGGAITLVLPTATGGAAPLSYSLTPLPPGLMLLAPTADHPPLLVGTPTQTASSPPETVTYTAYSADIRPTATLTFNIAVNLLRLDNLDFPNQAYTVGRAITPLTLPSASGGTGTLIYTLRPASIRIPPIPPGLTFNPVMRTLSGTPTEPSAATNMVYSATDANLAAVSGTFSLTVAPVPTPSIPPQVYTVNQDVAVTLPFAGGTAPFTYTLTRIDSGRVLPSGLTFNSVTGAIVGSPKVLFGDINGVSLRYTVTDANGASAEQVFTLRVVNPPPVFDTSTIPALASSYEYIAGVSIPPLLLPPATGIGLLSYTLTPVDSIQGLTFDADTRSLSGTPISAVPAITLTYTVTGGSPQAPTIATLNFTVTVNLSGITWVGGAFVETDANDGAVSGQLVATLHGNTFASPLSGDDFDVLRVPPGLTFQVTRTSDTVATLTLSGKADDHAHADDVSDAGISLTRGAFENQPAVLAAVSNYSYDGITIDFRAPGPPTFGVVIPNQSYTAYTAITTLTLPEAVGGFEPLSYALLPAESIPTGLTFDSDNRTLSGTPTNAPATVTLIYTGTDADSPPVTTALVFTVTIAPGITPTNVSATGVPLITFTGDLGPLVTLSVDLSPVSDDNGLPADAAAYTYQWQQGPDTGDDSGYDDLPGATGSEFTLNASHADRRIRVKVSFTDNAGYEEVVFSAGTDPVPAPDVANIPVDGSSFSISGNAQAGQTLSANTSTITDGNGLGTFSFIWQQGAEDGSDSGYTDLPGATTGNLFLTENHVGRRIRVVVSFIDAVGYPEEVTAVTGAVVIAAATINTEASGLPAISGTAQAGQTLSANTSDITDDNGLGTFSLFWQQGAADGSDSGYTDLPGATGVNLALSVDHIGRRIRVVVSFYDALGYSEVTTSTATAVVIAAPPPGLVLTPATLVLIEGTSATYTVALATQPATTVLVAITDENPDVTITPAILTFTTDDWETPQPVTVTALDDADGENEVATLMHIAANGYDATAILTVTVIDDDTGFILIPDSLSMNENTTITYSVALKSQPTGMVTVSIDSDNTEVTVNPRTLTFSTTNWHITKLVTVTAGEDADAAPDTAMLTHTAREGASISATATMVVTVTDNDTAVLRMADVNVVEGDTATVTVSLNFAVPGGFRVDTLTTDGTATAGEDYTAVTRQTLTFAGDAGEEQTFMIDITDDPDPENAETLTVSLASLRGTSVAVGLPAATVIIIDDDNTAVLTMENVEVAEDVGTASVIVSVDNAVSGGFTVDAVIADGTATANIDYTAVTSQTLTFDGTAGQTHTFMITITEDAVAESDETVTVSLTNLQDTTDTIGMPVAATVTIADNDSAALTLTMADVTVDEGGDGTTTVTVSLDNAVQDGFTVDALIADGTATATASADYTAVTSQTLTFAGTADEAHILTITITDDDVPENAETLTVSLASLQGTSVAVGLPDAATVIIIDNDNTALLTMANVGVTEDVGTASVIVTVDNAVPGGFEVNAATADGTATAGADYTALTGQTLTFAGTAGETRTFMVTINDDAVAEGVETFMASLNFLILAGSDPSLTVGLPVAATVTITDNDSAALTLTMTDVTVNEGDGTASVSVSLNTAVQGGFTVAALTADGTATEGADYTAVTSQILTFDGTPGETQTATITITDDSVAEGNETLMVSLSDLQTSGRAVMLPAGTATVTIMDNDSAALTMKDVDVTEGDGTATVATVTVSLDIAVQGGFAVDVATADGTAMAVDDYTAITGHTLTFAGTVGETQTFTVTIIDNDVPEDAETLMVSLGSLQDTGAMVVLSDVASVIITDDDNTAVLTIEKVEVTESDGTANVIVSVDNEVSGGFEVDAAIADGTATAGVDYTAAIRQTLTFAGTAGEAHTFMITINEDEVAEGDETLMVSLVGPPVLTGIDNSLTVGLPVAATITIADNDSAALMIAVADVAEDDGMASVVVSLNIAVQGNFTVVASTTDGTATADADYTAVTSQTLAFAGTASESQTFTIAIINDAVAENAETLTVSLASLQGTSVAVGLPDAATVIIIDDDNTAVLTMANVGVTEADGTASVIVSVDNEVSGGFTVEAAIADGTATAGADYTAVTSQTLTFAGTAGETKTFTLDITDDAVAEATETVTVSLARLQGTTVTVGLPVAATVAITDNDSAALTMEGVDVTEGDGTASVATVTVSLDIAVQGGFTVEVATEDGTAMAGADYTAITSHILNFAGTVGETQTFTVTITADDVPENAETLMVSLVSLQGTSATVGLPAAATVIIIDDDNTAVLTMENVEVDEADGTAGVIVSVDNAVSGGFTVEAAIADGTTTAGIDYTAVSSQTLTFAGTAGETKTLTLSITDDAVAEATETATVSLASLQGTTMTVGLPVAATVTITDNDSAALTMEDVDVTEGDGTATVATVTVSLDIAVQGGFTVDVATADGTAMAGDDYTAITGHTLTFAGSADEAHTFMIDITADDDPENAETLVVSLGSLQDTSVMVGLPAAATVVITDDDNTAVLTIENVEVTEADGTASVIVSVDKEVSGGFTVEAAIADGTATVDVDYSAVPSQTLTFAGTAGQAHTFMITITDDVVAEGAETVMVSLSGLQVTGATVGLPVAATITITDNDSAALMMVVADVAEGDGMASVVVSLDVAVQDGFTVAASTTAATATATAGADYTAVTDQALTFAGTAGESQTFTIAITDDAVAENAETLMVSLASLQGTVATVDLPDAATITIADNDSAALMIAAADVTEDGGMASVVVSLDIAVQGSFTVVASTTDGTATATATATTGADYTAVTSQTLAFAGTASESQTFTIAIINDAVAENAETLTVSLASLQGTSVAVGLPAAATVIIIDDDNTAVLTMANVGVTEG